MITNNRGHHIYRQSTETAVRESFSSGLAFPRPEIVVSPESTAPEGVALGWRKRNQLLHSAIGPPDLLHPLAQKPCKRSSDVRIIGVSRGT